MPGVIVPGAFIIGAALPYYRDVGVLTAWAGVGATLDDAVARVTQEWYAPDINGEFEEIQELDYLSRQSMEIEFTLAEVAGSKFSLPIAGSTSATDATTDTGGGGSTTLAVAAAIGDTSVKVVAITNFSAGDWMRINASGGGLEEYRIIDVVGTAGSGGTGLQFRDPLQKAHANGVAVVETVGGGKTVITPASRRRQPATAYKSWALVAEAPNGYYELLLDSGISNTDTAEISFGDETTGAIRTMIASRRNGATPGVRPWRIRVPA